HLTERFRRNQILRPEQLHELSVIHLRHEHAIKPLEQVAEVAREGTQVPYVNVRDIASLIARDLHRLMNRSERGAPADNGQRAVILTDRDVLQWNVARDSGDLVGTSLGHPCVIVGIIRDVARVIIALEAADAMLESRRPW